MKRPNQTVEVMANAPLTELKLWIFGESDPKTPKPAIVFFFGGGWTGGTGLDQKVKSHFKSSA
jgi:acetyl esterase/lipase